jgi:hypothetical protein
VDAGLCVRSSVRAVLPHAASGGDEREEGFGVPSRYSVSATDEWVVAVGEAGREPYGAFLTGAETFADEIARVASRPR